MGYITFNKNLMSQRKAQGCDFVCIFIEEVSLYYDKDSLKFFCTFSLFKLELSMKYLP